MCKWCEDLRNVQPAKFVSCSGGDPDWLKEAKKSKQFLMFKGDICYAIMKCPYCGQVFEGNEELYDTYEGE